MENNKFKIGDKVVELMQGIKCEIIADKDTPYKFAPLLKDIYPNAGCDFVLKERDLKGRGVVPFIHSPEGLLELDID